jgi:ribosomal protein L16
VVRNGSFAEASANASLASASVTPSISNRILPGWISQKPAEVRMGNGKGNPEYFVCEIQPGKILFEMDGVTEALAKEAFALASAKLPFRTTSVQRMLG